jgi:hypothetical protein
LSPISIKTNKFTVTNIVMAVSETATNNATNVMVRTQYSQTFDLLTPLKKHPTANAWRVMERAGEDLYQSIGWSPSITNHSLLYVNQGAAPAEIGILIWRKTGPPRPANLRTPRAPLPPMPPLPLPPSVE